MADVASFRMALQRCGVNQGAALDEIISQGFVSIDEFSTLSEHDIDDFYKAINKTPERMAGDPKPQVGFAAVKKLKAMRNWALERKRIGLKIEHDEFTQQELVRILARMDEERNFAINEPSAPPLPEKFVSFGLKWRGFSDGLQGHCSVVRGCMNIPLSYLMRELEKPTDEMLAADSIPGIFKSTDERLMALVRLKGAEFQLDNKRLWDILRPLVHGTTAWDYVKICERDHDGRHAFQILKARGEGDAATDARRTRAEAIIAKATLREGNKRFTLGSYINMLQGAFNDLSECNEPYSERKKVDTFVKGLAANGYQVIRATIMSDPAKRDNFQAAYAYAETMENLRPITNGAADGFDRNVSTVGVQGKRVGNKKDGWLPKAEWRKLSPEEKKKRRARYGKRGKKGKEGPGNGGGNNLKRKLSELAADTVRGIEDREEESDDSQDRKPRAKGKKASTASGEPHDQFGRNVHKLAKFAQSVIAELDSDGQKKKK